MKNNKPVENLQQVRFKLAEKWAAYENDEITDKEAKVHIGFGTSLINACKVEVIRQHFTGLTEQIDFLDTKPNQKGISNDFFNEKGKKKTA